MPDLSGPAADAPDTITTAGLAVGDATQEYSDTVAAGEVISQSPAAGTSVDIGSRVDYVESLGVQTVEVPDLSGPAADVEPTLTAAGLAVGSMTQQYSDTVPLDEVISQSPAADTSVDIGSAVDYVVSLGVQQVEVPDLSGPAADAPDTITAAGLAVGDATQEYSDTVAAGEVISQSPAAGTSVDIGSRVDYVVSLGVQTGRGARPLRPRRRRATRRLTAAGLAVGSMTQQYSDTVPLDEVISQSPAADTRSRSARPSTTSSRSACSRSRCPISPAPPPMHPTPSPPPASPSATPPRSTATPSPRGEVISQSPAAGTSVDIGSRVDYVESLGVQTVEVPDLSGPAADVEQTLTDAGLAVGSMTQQYSDTVPLDEVISQSPAADTEVAVGSAVDYVVSLGVQQVEVPDLSGPAADAPDTITTAGLAVGDATQEYSDTVAAGEVISQSPAAGTSVDIGSRVDYVESLGVQTVEVPDLSGPAADVEQTLTDAGLAVGSMTQQYSDTVPLDEVISQSPAADTRSRSARPSTTSSRSACSRSRCPISPAPPPMHPTPSPPPASPSATPPRSTATPSPRARSSASPPPRARAWTSAAASTTSRASACRGRGARGSWTARG